MTYKNKLKLYLVKAVCFFYDYRTVNKRKRRIAAIAKQVAEAQAEIDKNNMKIFILEETNDLRDTIITLMDGTIELQTAVLKLSKEIENLKKK